MASTSWGFSWSAPMTVPTTWVSLRKPVGERRPQRPVDEAAGQDGLVGRAALTAEERAGDLAGGVHPLLDVDGEREEVDALPDVLGGVGGDEHGGVADAGRRPRPADCGASLPVSKVRVLSVPGDGTGDGDGFSHGASPLRADRRPRSGAAAASSQSATSRPDRPSMERLPGDRRLAADRARRRWCRCLAMAADVGGPETSGPWGRSGWC